MGRTLPPAVRGMVHGVTGAYVGAILFLVAVGIIDSFVHTQGAETLWTKESLPDLFLFSLAGIFMFGWWIIPLGVFFGEYFGPKLPQWPRKAAVIRGILLGAAHSSILRSLLLAQRADTHHSNIVCVSTRVLCRVVRRVFVAQGKSRLRT